MKHLIFLTALLSIFIDGLGQLTPHVLILSPSSVTFEKSIEKELSKNVDGYKESLDLAEADKFLKSKDFKKRPENIQRIGESEVEFLKIINHENIVSYLGEQFLADKVLQKFKDAVLQLSPEKSTGSVEELKKLGAKNRSGYVLNFKSLNYFKEGRQSFLKLTAQLYDCSENRLLLEKDFTGGWESSGFEYACEEKSVNCCINNALSQVVKDVIRLLSANDPAGKKQQQLVNDRWAVLQAGYLQEPFDPASVKALIPESDETIDLATCYRVIFNPDKTQFVAFFIQNTPEGDGKAFREEKNDRNINIVSDDGMGFFSGTLPDKYAHIVKGVLYQGKWYYEKDQVTYFDAEESAAPDAYLANLFKWNFFKENSTELNPLFWEGIGEGRTLQTAWLFDRVRDVRQDPEWDKTSEYQVKQEEENRPYIGLFTIVANQLKEKR